MPEHSAHSSQVIPPVSEVPRLGELLAGKYRIESTLGVGGMGVVLAARNELIGQPVAIKFLVVNDEEYLGEAAQRLLREARAAARLRGEHVVRIYDVGELPNGTPFIVMERLHGADLGEIAQGLGPMPIPVAVGLIAQAARAISEAHAAGIVHRDLKPSNLFICKQPDGKALLKVVDFGISKSMQRDAVETKTLTGARMALGSPHYMSPEQVRDARRVDTRTDIWALGVILYELIAGRPAFQADSYPGIFAAITADVPAPLSSLRPEVAAGLELAIARCLERDPALRYQSAEELAQALDAYRARDIEFAELFPAQRAEASPSTLRAAPEALPSGQRPAPSRKLAEEPVAAAPSATITKDTHTQLSALLRAEPTEPEAPSQDVPAIAQSERAGDGPITRRSGAADPTSTAQKSTQRWVVTLGGLAVGLGLLWQLAQRQGNRTAEAPSSSVKPAPAPVRSVVIAIETNPAGARVSEQGHELGTTPFKLTLPSGAETERPRTFVLTLDGYRPHVFERAPGPDGTFVHVDLVRASPAESAPPTAAPSPTPPPHSAPVTPRVRPPRVETPPPKPETPPDIRLVR